MISVNDTERRVITFYSYKGGTGRSMLVANVAWLLASSGHRVLVIDWDLEAPGLHRYFKPFLGDSEMKNQEGVIQWLQDYWDAAAESPSKDILAIVKQYADPRRYVIRLQTDEYLKSSSGGIDFMSAGRQDDTYAEAVASYDFSRLYGELQGADFIAASKSILLGDGGYDYVLIDSRTGISDTAGICTVGLADTLIICFTYNNQSVIGASNVARRAKEQAQLLRSSKDAFGAYKRYFQVIGVPSRVDSLDPERLQRRRSAAWTAFQDVVTATSDHAKDLGESLIGLELPYHPIYAYEESLAACMERIEDRRGILSATLGIVQRITGRSSADLPGLTPSEQHIMRSAFAAATESEVTAIPVTTCWELVTQMLPTATERAALLEECFRLLVQLFSTQSISEVEVESSQFLKQPLSESDLGTEESRMAEHLLRLSVIRRRPLSDGTRVLEIGDESILANWHELRERLSALTSFMRQRESVKNARLSWETGGKRLASLLEAPETLATIEIVGEQAVWLGVKNLEYLQSVREAKAEANRLHASEAKFASEQEAAKTRIELTYEHLTVFRRTQIASVMLILVILVVGSIWLHQKNVKFETKESEFNKQQVDFATEMQIKKDELMKQAENEALRLATDIAKKELVLKLISYGTAEVDMKRFSEAERYFGRALDIEPTSVEALQRRANLYFSQGRIREELTDLAKLVNLRPSLSKRADVIRRSMNVSPLDKALIREQLGLLTGDAKPMSTSRDTDPTDVAQGLIKDYIKFPVEMRVDLEKTINELAPVDGAEKLEREGKFAKLRNSKPKQSIQSVEIPLQPKGDNESATSK